MKSIVLISKAGFYATKKRIPYWTKNHKSAYLFRSMRFARTVQGFVRAKTKIIKGDINEHTLHTHGFDGPEGVHVPQAPRPLLHTGQEDEQQS